MNQLRSVLIFFSIKKLKARLQMNMLHRSSGKDGFEYYKPKNINPFSIFPKPLLKLIYIKEQELRRSDSIQQAYTDADTDTNKIQQINEDVQYAAILSVMSPPTNIDKSTLLKHFRAARSLVAEDPEFNQLTDYFKYDEAFRNIKTPFLSSGRIVPIEGIQLHSLDGSSLPLSQLIHKNMAKPLLLIAGSLS